MRLHSLYPNRPVNGEPITDDLDRSGPRQADTSRQRASLTRQVELRRTRNDHGDDYLAILIRKPLDDTDIETVWQFLTLIDPESNWRHPVTPGELTRV
jgi:hypothetical protein